MSNEKTPREYKKGQIYYIESKDDDVPKGSVIWSNRPGVIVSNDTNNKYGPVVNVVYLTSKPKKASPTHVPLKIKNTASTALCEQIHAVDKIQLKGYIGSLTEKELQNINAALQLSLNISDKNSNICGIFKKWESYIQKYKIYDDEKQSQEIDDLKKERDCYKMLVELYQKQQDNY